MKKLTLITATLGAFVSQAGAQLSPQSGEMWQMKVDGFGCVKNEDLEKLVNLVSQHDQKAFSTLLLKLGGVGACQSMPKGLRVIVDHTASYGVFGNHPCVREIDNPDCWYTSPTFLEPAPKN